MGKTSTKDIQDFLCQCREIIQSNKVVPSNFWFISKKENRDTLLALGFSLQDIKYEISNLSLDNYCEGPCDAHEHKDQVWIFGKIMNNREIYIKLCISDFDNAGNKIKTLYCLSFHFAQKPMNHPYKRN